MGITSVLLDTHVVLWALMEPERLSSKARRTIEAMETELWISAASAWELAIKFRAGKLPEAGAAVTGYEEHLRRLGATELPISSKDALQAGLFTHQHRDPFDSMLAAQSMIRQLPLITQDEAFAQFPVTVLW